MYVFGVSIQYPSLKLSMLESDLPTLSSVFMLGFIFIIMFGLLYNSEVSKFESDQKLIIQVQRNQKIQEDFLTAIQGFVCKLIFNKIQKEYFKNNMNINSAVDEVLRMRQCTIAVLHTDIRKYTVNSFNMDTYLLNEAIPNIQAITELCEQNETVTRLVGDLILSYSEDILIIIKLGIEALDVMLTLKSNKNEASKITRYILISYGVALTGNIGAANSGREVTAMGPPVNILSRIDRLTKNKYFANLLDVKPVLVLTQLAMNQVLQEIPNLSGQERIDLKANGFLIDDFPNEECLYLLPHSRDLYETIKAKIGNKNV